MGRRLDAAIALRGLARSRTHAASLIERGLVRVDGKPAHKSSIRVREDAVVVIDVVEPYVGRGAYKLLAALNAFDAVDTEGVTALDVGASTGGFTQVLLERGVREVIAIDVGHGQLAPEVARDPRVRSFEGVNARELTRESLATMRGDNEGIPSLVVIDVSFVSLTQLLRPLNCAVDRAADFIVLVKPQFEVGRSRIADGIVRNPVLRAESISRVAESAFAEGLRTRGIIAAPVKGEHGNQEYLMWLSPREGAGPEEWLPTISRVVAE